MLEAPPNVYDILRTRGGMMPVPSISEVSFVSAYEESYGSLYRRLLRILGHSCSDGLSHGEARALTDYLRVRSLKTEAFLFTADAPCPANPLLVNCESVQSLIGHWFSNSDHCFFASNGLMYPTKEALVEFGPGGLPANSIVAEDIRLRRGEHILLHESEDGPELSDQFAIEAPGELFRGQRSKWSPLAPFVRPLVDTSMNATRRREEVKFLVSDWMLENADHSLLATTNYALFLSWRLSLNHPDRTTNTLLPTPYNLLWRFAPWQPETVIRLCEDVFESVCTSTATWGSAAEMAIFLSHMTDHAYPVPVHASVQFVTDFVPNPLVSTTTDIMRALLYASHYFEKFEDKFNVDWDRVEHCIEIGTGYVLLIRFPRMRKIVPISQIARRLPPPYRSIGALESEFGIPGAVKPDEIAEWREASDVLSRLRKAGIWSDLRREPGSVEPDRIAKVVFGR